MKKCLSLLLVLMLVLSLTACGSDNSKESASEPVSTSEPTSASTDATETESTPETTPETTPEPTTEAAPTKDELLKVAEEADANDINNACFDNIAKAKLTYCNKTLELTGTVRTVQEDHVELAGFYGATYFVDVYLPLEELVELESGQRIVVVGNTTDEIVDSSESVAGYTFEYKRFQMPLAYLVKDRVTVTGILMGVNNSYRPAYNIKIGTSNVLKLIYLSDKVDTSTLTYGQEITFSAKAININDSWRYYDAEIIK